MLLNNIFYLHNTEIDGIESREKRFVLVNRFREEDKIMLLRSFVIIRMRVKLKSRFCSGSEEKVVLSDEDLSCDI